MSDEIPDYLPAELVEHRERNKAPAQLETIAEGDWQRWLADPGPNFNSAPRKRPLFTLVDGGKQGWAGKHARSCGACEHTRMYGDPRRGWCTEMRLAVSLAYPVLCRGFTPSQ